MLRQGPFSLHAVYTFLLMLLLELCDVLFLFVIIVTNHSLQVNKCFLSFFPLNIKLIMFPFCLVWCSEQKNIIATFPTKGLIALTEEPECGQAARDYLSRLQVLFIR
jgi:hypothetical protein